MSKSVLVTGATGKTGSEVVKGLIAKGETVRVGAHTPEKGSAMFGSHAGVQVVPLDLGRPETFDAALAGVDRVYLLAVTGETAPDQALMPFVDRAKSAGVRHIAYMTTAGSRWTRTIRCARWSGISRSRVCPIRFCGRAGSCRTSAAASLRR